MTDRLLAWLKGPHRLDELQRLEESIHLHFEALPPGSNAVDRILREAAEEALNTYLEVVELGYDHLELGADLQPAHERLAEGSAAMSRYDSLVDQVRQQLSVPRERGLG